MSHDTDRVNIYSQGLVLQKLFPILIIGELD